MPGPRSIAALLAFSGVGAVLSAWAMAILSPTGPSPLPALPPQWLAPTPKSWPPPNGYMITFAGFGVDWSVQRYDQLVTSANGSTAAMLPSYRQASIRAGWPFRSLRADRTTVAADNGHQFPTTAPGTWLEHIRAGIQVRPMVGAGAPQLGRPLPLVPIWAGLLGNTLLLALALSPILLVRPLRRSLHRRRGCCAECGHPVPPNQPRCSECGASRVAA